MIFKKILGIFKNKSDPYNLERFRIAQETDFNMALSEIKNGQKESHWMWYIFPQLKELGFSPTSKKYGIRGDDEAKAYLEDKYLHDNLITISKVLLEFAETDPEAIFSYPDNLKLRSCMTLFYLVSEKPGDKYVFKSVLDQYFSGILDENTVEILNKQ